MGRILVAGSQASRRRDIAAALEGERHAVTEASTAREAIDGALYGSHDLLILDAELEGAGQPSMCRTIRAAVDLGIIALIAESSTERCAAALNAGADDYLPENFVPAELNARVRAILRRVRPGNSGEDEIFLTDRTIDLRSHKVRGPGDAIANLRPREFQVLKYLIDRGGEPIAIQDLARHVWQRDGRGDLEYVRIVISQLRSKLERDRTRPAHIVTARAGGYSFTPVFSPCALPPWRTDNQATAL